MKTLTALTAIIALASCTPGSFASGTNPGPGPSPGASTQTIDVDLTKDPGGSTPGGSGGGYSPLVTTVTRGSFVRFTNSDGFNHTATAIAGTTFPTAYPFTSVALTQAGTTLSGGFSTGSLASGTSSQALLADAAGTYLFGCFYHYGTPMRAAIVVK